MVLMCQRLLPEAQRDIYLQGALSFTLPKGHTSVSVYCSPHNPGARELAEELNAAFSSSTGPSGRRSAERTSSSRRTSSNFASSTGLGGRRSTNSRSIRRTSSRLSRRLSPGILQSRGVSSSRYSVSGHFLEIVDELGSSEADPKCDHMLVYLNAVTWMHDPEALAVDIREAQRLGVHLQPCHEFPSALDSGSSGSMRKALNFKQIMDTTPPDLTIGARNIYKQIAISLKGGELREVGLAALASKLVTRVPLAPISSSRSDTNCGASERTPARKLTKSNSLNNLTAATRAAATPVAATPAAAKHAPLHAPLARAITLGSFRRGSITQLTTTTLTTFRRSSVTQLKGARSETLNKWKQASQL